MIFSMFILLAAGLCFFIEKVIIKEIYSVNIYAVVFPCVIGAVWTVACIGAAVFAETIRIDNDAITAVRFRKELWRIKRENIDVCLYCKFEWRYLFIPVAALASGDLMFRMKHGRISKYSCCLPYKQIERIRNLFDYPIEIIKE